MQKRTGAELQKNSCHQNIRHCDRPMIRKSKSLGPFGKVVADHEHTRVTIFRGNRKGQYVDRSAFKRGMQRWCPGTKVRGFVPPPPLPPDLPELTNLTYPTPSFYITPLSRPAVVSLQPLQCPVDALVTTGPMMV